MTFRPTHMLTLPVRRDYDGDLWFCQHGEEQGFFDPEDLTYTSLEPIPRTFEVNDRVILRSARQDDIKVVWTIIGIDDQNVWLRRQGSTSVFCNTTLYSTSRTEALEHAQ